MTWTPISREELDELLAEGLEEADDEVLSVWAAMRVEPQKWRCSPMGDLGGGFWVVASRDGIVTWYNDIEHGFNESPIVRDGEFSDYWCNQDDFGQYLRRLPQAQTSPAWSSSRESDPVPDELRKAGRITRRQTTYWTLETSAGACWRVRFLDKEEFAFRGASYGSVEITEHHPLLTNHHAPWDSLYFSGKPTGVDRAMAAARAAVLRETQGWRELADYYNPGAPLSGGSGLFMRAPRGLIAPVRAVLDAAGCTTSVLEGAAKPRAHRVCLLDRSYVIAHAFRFEFMRQNDPSLLMHSVSGLARQ